MFGHLSDTLSMNRMLLKSPTRQAAKQVLKQIESGGERVWRMQDFGSLPFGAVAQALSRLNRKGALQRLGKGVYFRPRKTAFGSSRPNPALIRSAAAKKGKLFPAGVSAANVLGFTTQNSAKAEIATTAGSVPRLLQNRDTVVHPRRPAAWESLSETDGAVLEFLRLRGEPSELSPGETIERLLTLLRESGRFARLVSAAATEPPRVRAMLGALGEKLGASTNLLRKLKASLNPLTRFDFGVLAELDSATRWQAKERRAGAPL
jgi:hypothetical protein